MTPLALILFILFVYGVVYGVVQASLVAPARMWLASKSIWLEEGLYCPWCISLWVGLATWYPFIGRVDVWIGAFVAVGAMHFVPRDIWTSHSVEGELVSELRRMR